MYVMDMLEPHRNLKGLTIAYFGGKKFSSWLGDPSFTKIVRLHIFGCERIISLPSLGRLPSLKNLHVERMGEVKSVGLEFNGDTSHSVIPFPSLETLIFQDMSEWEEWSSSTNVDECKFPCLRELQIVNCPMLIGKLPGHLTSLAKLSIRRCPLLAFSFVSLPSLHELALEECNTMVLRSMADLNSLTTLRMKRISELTCLHERRMHFLVALKVLVIEDCGEMTTLWQSKAELENLTCLKELEIIKCPKLVSFSVGGVPPSLKRLVLENCEALECLPDNINSCVLEDVQIEKCLSLKFLPKGKLPITLKSLTIRSCENLQSFSNERIVHNPHLEYLSISDCPSLVCFPTKEFPTALKNFDIKTCVQLEESVLERALLHNTSLETVSITQWTKLKSIPDCLHCLTHLTYLKINYCPALESFPERGLLIPNLTRLYIINCKSLKSLPNQMQNLLSLQDLNIWKCPNIVSIPESGFPTNLTSLYLSDCKNMKQPLQEWGLHRLTSLRELSIYGKCDAFRDMVSFPDDEHDCTLPTTLINLSIRSFLNLETLSRGLQNLTSLEKLLIWKCPKLQSLPKESLLATLGFLNIRDCPLLED